MTIYEKLSNIQNKIKVEKTEYNKFGGYNYRTAENILKAVKPELAKEKLLLTMTDEIVNINERYYVKAIVSITDGENTVTTSAYAREITEKSKFDESQLTGSASTYARKYALCGIFAIDGDEDPDAMQNEPTKPTRTKTTTTKEPTVEKQQLEVLFNTVLKTQEEKELFKTIMEKYGYQKSTDIKAKDYKTIIKELNEAILKLKNNATEEAPF